MAPISKLSSWEAQLEPVRKFPCISSTHAVLNLPALCNFLRGEIGKRDEDHPPVQEKINTLINKAFSANVATRTVAMTMINYIAMRSLCTLSLYVNGAIGTSKLVLSGLHVFNDYKTAQNLLEEGFFHLLVATTDFAIGSFALMRGSLSIFSAIAPQQANELFQMAYRPWNGAIEQADDTDESKMSAKRKDYSLLQASADALQVFILPNNGQGRIQGALAALNGKKE